MAPDITMCREDQCLRRMTCYRYMAKPDPYWQSYFNWAGSAIIDYENCDYYMPVEEVKDENVSRPRV